MVTGARLGPTIIGVLLALLCIAGAATAQVTSAQDRAAQDSVDPTDATLEVIVDPSPAEPIEGEMLLVTIRGAYLYKLNITLEKFTQPDLAGFSWVQLERDRWSKQMIGGRQMRVFERRLGLYPKHGGRIMVGPFRHVLTLAGDNGGRFEHEVRSPPLGIEVRPKPPTAEWWLPARSVRVTDEWDRPPDSLANGDVAKRTVTLEAEGLPAQFLPPMPRMGSSGVITFIDPEERTMRLTPDGPVSRVVWRWSVRPASSAPANLEAANVPWFDTVARQPREIVLAPQKIAFAANSEPLSEPLYLRLSKRFAALIGALCGLGCGATVLLARYRRTARVRLSPWFRRMLPDPDRTALRHAVRRQDPMATRAAARKVVHKMDRQGRATAGLDNLLSGLDRELFAQGATDASPDLKAFLRRLRLALGRRALATKHPLGQR